MTDEERAKYDEMAEAAERAKEEAEKAKKIMRQDLKKLLQEQAEITTSYDRMLGIAHMKRLEVQYIILEQELLLLRIWKDLSMAEAGKRDLVEASLEEERAQKLLETKMLKLQQLEKDIMELQNVVDLKNSELSKAENKYTKQLLPLIQSPKEDQKRWQ